MKSGMPDAREVDQNYIAVADLQRERGVHRCGRASRATLGADECEYPGRVSIATRKKERVALLKGIARVNLAGSNAPWNGVAPDGSPLIMRDVGNREIYSLELQLP